MKISVHNYNNISLINFKSINKTSGKIVQSKDFLPNISIYDTKIKDTRLKSLIVEKRENMLQQALLPPEYIYTDKEGISRIKPHLYIKRIVVRPEFLRQGVCREAEQKIIQLSREEGFEGRVLLYSSPIKGLEDYIPNPTIAHWANGFRFYGINCVKQMLEVLNGNISPKHAPIGDMYYPM